MNKRTNVFDILVRVRKEIKLWINEKNRLRKRRRLADIARKANYGAYGDTGHHLHFHLVPKYADDEFEWGGVFAMNPKRKYLTDTEYAQMVAEIAAELG